MIVLGINAFHGDAAAAILVDGQLVAAAEEERFTRVKHTAGFPSNAVRYCLDAAGVRIHEVDHVAIPRDTRARMVRKLIYSLRLPRFALGRARAHRSFDTVAECLAAALDVGPEFIRARIHRIEHHLAHIASAFFVSPFERAAVLSLDGLGDFGSGLWGIGEGNHIRSFSGVAFPHSLGLYYTALTQYLGFWKYGDEYKVMGLAAYGEPEHLPEFRKLVALRSGMGYSLDLRYFTHHRTGPAITWQAGEPVQQQLFSRALEKAFGPTRPPEQDLEARHRNIAATMQKRLEEVLIQQWCTLHKLTGETRLAYAGGVAYNCVANGRIFAETPFDQVYVQSAAGDAGLAIGAAFYVWHERLGRPRSFVMDHSYWGPEFADSDIRRALESRGLPFRRLELAPLTSETAKQIADGRVVGWFQGRMEWGPRALGNRSIIADPRRADMRDVLNQRIKRREPFRPFAPSILEERVGDYFEESHPSPFMLMTYRVRGNKRAEIAAPTHVDGTGRLQTVSRLANPRYWDLIAAFERETGVPVVLNTSFNENEPVVSTPQEAIECFIRTRMDVLAIGNYLVERDSSPARP